MSLFQFKEFSVNQSRSALKVGTDAMLLGAMVEVEASSNCLDIGAGTGVLSLMIAQRNSFVQIDAVEIDALSCLDCKANFQASPWRDRLRLYEQDILDFSQEKSYDLILSNPPFFLNGLLGENERVNRAKHNNSLPFHQLFRKVNELLTINGSFWMISPSTYFEGLLNIASQNDLYVNRMIQIYPKPSKVATRVILQVEKKKKELIENSFTIRDNAGRYTREYIELTKDFHNRPMV